MEMNSKKRIEAIPEKVWKALNDTEVLKASMPGCESFEATGENTFEAKITAKVGPVKAKFKFNVSLTDIDPPNGYTISGEGQGGAAGFAKGSAAVNLAGENGATILTYNVKANVGGKLAQLGGRLIDGTARKMATSLRLLPVKLKILMKLLPLIPKPHKKRVDCLSGLGLSG